MDTQDHMTAATSIGHEGHGVYLCHRCGWPFPKPHPSSKHRRAHKRHCGTIEGYKIIHSEEHDHNLTVSDDEHASDGEHTPSPNLVKKSAMDSGRIGDNSNKSEDDVYSDAVTDFADSGVSPRLEEHFESAKELNKSMDQKGVEGDLHGGGSLKVDEVADRNEQSYDPRKSEEVPNPEPLVSRTDESGSAEAILGQGPMKSEQDSDIQVQEDKLASVALNSEEGKISEEDICDNSVSEVVKHDLPSQTETLENLDASEEENSVVPSAKRSASYETVEVAFVDQTQENIDASVGVEEVSQSTKLSAKPDEGSQTLDATKHAASMASSIYKEVETKTSLGGGENARYFDASEKELCDMNGKENQDMELKESSAIDTVPTPDSAVKTFAPEDDQTTREFKKGVDHGEEKSNCKLLETGNEMEGALMDVRAVLDSKMPSDDSTGFPSSFAAVSEAKEEHGSLETRDDGFEKSIQRLDTDGSSRIGSEPNHDIGDVLVKNALPTASLEVPVSPIISEPSQNIGIGGVESVDVAETISQSKEIVSSEETPEQSIAKESAPLITESELLSEISANNVKTSESIDSAGVTGKLDHEDDVVSPRETSESPTPQVLEASPTSIVSSAELDGNVLASGKCSVTTPSLKEPPSDLLETRAIGHDKTVGTVEEDITGVDSKSLQAEVVDKMTKENDGVSAVTELDGNVLASEKCSVTPSLKEPLSDFRETCATGDDKTVGSVEDDITGVDSKSLQAEVVDKLTKENDGVSAVTELDGDVLASGKCSVTPSLKEPPSDFLEARATGDDETVGNVEVDITGVDSKSLQAEVVDKLTKENDGVSAVNRSGSSSSRSDSLEANCGSVVSDTVETNSQKQRTEEARSDKSDTFEAPSFMTLVQPGGEGEQVKGAKEIETEEKIQAGWFPSIKNVVNESEGRKKNEEIIAKVTNWSPVKQQHGPLKSLLNEVKSPNTKQAPASYQKIETETKEDNGSVATVGSVIAPESKDQETKKDVEEWNSPARYPIEIKKEKKKKVRSYWVPFVCCSSVHRDL